MVTEDQLLEHDRLNKKATARPWFNIIRKSGIYKRSVFWSRTPNKEVSFDSEPDIVYLTFIRNLSPDMVETIRQLNKELREANARERVLKDYAEELHAEIEQLREKKIMKDL
jgi:hypothetical protein